MAKDTGTAEAKKPEQDDDVPFVGAAAVTDAPDKKKDMEQPAFQEHPTAAAEAEAAKAKKAKDGEDFKPFEQNDLPPQEETAENKPKKPKPEEQQVYVAQDTYVPGISRQNMGLLNDAWGIATITRALDETLENARISHDEASGKMKFKLANGHKIEWLPEHNGIKGFIGFPHRTKMDDLDAKMVIATLASQGKESVNLYGNRESKEKMWLEAMRQGLQVTNFQPLPSDDPNSVYQKWLRESQALQTGAAADPRFPTQEKAIRPPGEEAAEPDAKKPADEKPAAGAEKPAEAATADKPVVEEDKNLKSTFLAGKPATEEKTPEKPAVTDPKAETPAKDAPAAGEKTPATAEAAAEKSAVKSTFLGDAAVTDKKGEAPTPTGPALPKNESFEETLDRRIKQAKNPEIEASLRTLKADYKSGALTLDSFDRQVIQEKLGGNKPLSATKVNAVIDYAAKKPENKDVVLPRVEEPKQQSSQRKHKGQTFG